MSGGASAAGDSLNPEQHAAVHHRDGPLVIVAGPGSGKTRVMTHRIAQLIATGVPAHQVLAITFTNKAADEMMQRTLKLLHPDAIDPVNAGAMTADLPRVSTFHSFCARLLRREIYHLPPYATNFGIYDTSDQKAAVERVLERLQLDRTAFTPSSSLNQISRWKNDMMSPEEVADQAHSYRDRQFARIFGTYQQSLEELNALDFDDLLLLTLRVLREIEHVRDRRRKMHRYLMIDEFQDTNRPQYLIARILAETHHNICITGDPDQSIYSWRGASPENFDLFSEDFPSRETVFLNRNYRSTPQILDVASRLTGTALGDRALVTDNPAGDDVHIRHVSNERKEARETVEQIVRWVAASSPLREIAVLYRVNSLSRSIEEELVRNSIPYTVVGGTAFYQRKEVKDILCYLRAAAFSRDDIAIRRIINTPNRKIGKVTLERIEELSIQQNCSLCEVVLNEEACTSLPPRTRNALASLRQILQELISLRGESIVSQVETAIEKSDYVAYLQRTEPETWEDRQQNLQELAAAAAESEHFIALALRNADQDDGPESPDVLQLFLERIALVSDIDQWEEREDRVALMSLHAAKGLEFDRVALIGVEETLLPHSRSDSDDNVEEERRLLYVGITRARQSLVLSHTHWRRRFREMEPRVPSRFLREIAGTSTVFHELEEEPAFGSRSSGTVSGNYGDRIGSFDTSFDDVVDYDDDDDELHVGVWVEHDIFGRGEIVAASGRGDRKVIRVRFGNQGEKRLVPTHAPIRIVGAP